VWTFSSQTRAPPIRFGPSFKSSLCRHHRSYGIRRPSLFQTPTTCLQYFLPFTAFSLPLPPRRLSPSHRISRLVWKQSQECWKWSLRGVEGLLDGCGHRSKLVLEAFSQETHICVELVLGKRTLWTFSQLGGRFIAAAVLTSGGSVGFRDDVQTVAPVYLK